MSPRASWILIHEVIPRLQSAVSSSVRPLGCEDSEELVQDGTAIAAGLLSSAEAKGKQITGGNAAYYTLQHLRAGRRSTGFSRADALVF